MAGFTPFKRHATAFKYTPRHYDPLKEEFEKRREELRGERRDSSSSNSEGEYTPGQYIRTKRMARIESNKQSSQANRKRNSWNMIIIIALFFLFASMILPKLGEFFSMASGVQNETTTEEVEEWNPYAPITVVPNDYVEGEE
ncbi:MAG: hypothetical protein SNG27_04515 [Rikenellaceae bacterium]